ncbi:hypothetical protein ACJRO7_005798 [Eucalyptus globulus]|uniref:Thionin-like protein 2 n=1 Tax=Eucalyptus globulus TaxID=34317 RepID=A0ABD3J836_EUCGL
MEKVKSVFVVCLVLALFLGQPSAIGMKPCFKRCYFRCVIDPRRSAAECCAKCMKHCAPPSSDSLKDAQYSCILGCAYPSCIAFSSKDEPREEKVAGLVDSCSERCTKHHGEPAI